MSAEKRASNRIIKKTLIASAIVILAGTAFVTVVGCLFSAPVYQGPKTTRFDGERFVNADGSTGKGFFKLIKWMSNRQQGPWTGQAKAQAGPAPPRRVGPGELRITFVNHATVLVQLDGLNILTDPIWSERASPVGWAGPKRVRPPGLDFDQLPPIDLVLISHNHYDHLDLPSLARLAEAHGPTFLVGLGNGKLLEKKGIGPVRELDWWQRLAVSESDQVRVTFVPARHFSQRGLFDGNGTLWGGFVIEGRRERIYFAGDTGYGDHFAQIRQTLGPVSVALLPIGAYKPRWFMEPVHISPEEAVQAHRDLAARVSVAMHFGTFPLGDDGEQEPVQDLHAAMAKAGIGPDDFLVLGFGEGRNLASPAPLTGDRTDQGACAAVAEADTGEDRMPKLSGCMENRAPATKM